MKLARFALVLVLSVVVLLLTVAGVSAAPLAQATDTETPTVTPSATITPVPFAFATERTPAPTPDNLYCPGAPPNGWGTVTPGEAWLALCGQCFDGETWVGSNPTATPSPTLYKTSTLGPSPTGGPSPTPTLTRTPTITPTPSKTATPTKSYQVVDYIPPFGPWMGVSPGGGVQNSHYSAVDMGAGNTAQFIGSTTGVTWSLACHTAGSDSLKIQLCTSSNGTSCAGTPRMEFTCGALEGRDRSFSGRMLFGGNDGPNRFVLARVVTTGASGQWGLYAAQLDTVYVQWALQPTATQTPIAPTITPGPGFCNNVAPDSEVGFQYTGITFGESKCLDIGPVAEFEFLGFTFPGIPWIAHLCLQAVSLGAITVFGLGIALDLIAVVAGVILIVREFT